MEALLDSTAKLKGQFRKAALGFLNLKNDRQRGTIENSGRRLLGIYPKDLLKIFVYFHYDSVYSFSLWREGVHFSTIPGVQS